MLGTMSHTLHYLGAIPGFIGVALLLYALLATLFGRKDRPPRLPARDRPRTDRPRRRRASRAGNICLGWRSLARFRGGSAFPACLLGLAPNHWRNARRLRRCAPLEQPGAGALVVPATTAESDLHEDLTAALAHLNPDERLTRQLHSPQSLSQAEIAALPDWPVGTAKLISLAKSAAPPTPSRVEPANLNPPPGPDEAGLAALPPPARPTVRRSHLAGCTAAGRPRHRPRLGHRRVSLRFARHLPAGPERSGTAWRESHRADGARRLSRSRAPQRSTRCARPLADGL
jgi:hypothetical protein